MGDDEISLRTDLRPGDIDEVVRLHGRLYAREYGFDATFAEYVAGALAAFAQPPDRAQRLWIAERAGRIVGCIAIVPADESVAQLRTYLVAPDARGVGLGTRLIRTAVAFARSAGYERVILYTVARLTAASRRYRAAGFRMTESRALRAWGCDVVEERYDLELDG